VFPLYIGIPSARVRAPAPAEAGQGARGARRGLGVRGIWALLLDLVANGGGSDARDEPAMLVVGVLTGLVAAFLLSTPTA
jgi:hypothetical protein